MAKARARAPPAFCSLSKYFVLLWGLALTKSIIAGPVHGVTLANPQGLSSPELAHLLRIGVSVLAVAFAEFSRNQVARYACMGSYGCWQN